MTLVVKEVPCHVLGLWGLERSSACARSRADTVRFWIAARLSASGPPQAAESMRRARLAVKGRVEKRARK